MKIARTLGGLFTCLVLANCGGSSPTGDEKPAALLRPNLVAASSETAAEVGVISWEIVRDRESARVLGRDDGARTLVDVAWSHDDRACPEGGGAIVTTVATLPAAGTRSVGCGGKVMADSLDPLTRRAVDLLFADLDTLDPAGTDTRKAQGFSMPYPPGGPINNPTPGYCAPHTSTHCYGVVERCTDTFANCTTSTRTCGVCFGIW